MHNQGRMCKEFRGKGLVLVTLDRLFTKTILQRSNAIEKQTYISIPLIDAPYLYPHCLSLPHCFPQFLLLQWHS